MKKIGIVILNYQTWELSLRCMESIHRTCRGLNYQIYFVDNASKRPMPDLFRQRAGSDFVFLQAKENRGYAAGNNLGFQKALADGCGVIVAANSDIVFREHAVEKLADCLAANPKIGIAAPKVVNAKNEIQASRCSMRTGIKEMFQVYTAAKWLFGRKWRRYYCLEQDPDVPAEVYHVSGCCFAISRECAQQVMPFDEGTVLYYEEPILGIRMEQAGYLTRYEPGSVVLHQHGAASEQVRPFMYQCICQSELYYCSKYLHAQKWQLSMFYHYRRLLYLVRSITDKEMRGYWDTFRKKTHLFYQKALQTRQMTILHYLPGLPPVRDGGLARYAMDLIRQEMRMGEKAMLLIPGVIPKNASRKAKIKRYKSHALGMPAYTVFHPLPIPMGNGITDIGAFTETCDSRIYVDFLRRVKPDIIHIHTLMGLHQEFLEAARRLGIPTVFTTHDYFGLCPKSDLMFAGKICKDREWSKCGFCCSSAYSAKRLRIEQSGWYRFYRKHKWMVSIVHKGIGKNVRKELRAPAVANVQRADAVIPKSIQDYSRLRAYYFGMFAKITCFHFNSTIAEEMYSSRLGEIRGQVIGISHSGIGDHRRKRRTGKKLRLGYFGGWLEHKGFFLLMDVCTDMYAHGYREMELHICSETQQRKEAFVVCHPRYAAQQMQHMFCQIDLLVVPSIWQETFGLVVLEALSFGVPVVISKNVGAKDLLTRNPGCGIEYDGSAEGLRRVLVHIYEHRGTLREMNRRIRAMGDEFSYEEHVKQVLKLYQELRKNRMHQEREHEISEGIVGIPGDGGKPGKEGFKEQV